MRAHPKEGSQVHLTAEIFGMPTQLRPPASISVFSLRLTQPHTWASAAILIDKYYARGFKGAADS